MPRPQREVYCGFTNKGIYPAKDIFKPCNGEGPTTMYLWYLISTSYINRPHLIPGDLITKTIFDHQHLQQLVAGSGNPPMEPNPE